MTHKSTVRPFVYVDVETTGLDSEVDELVELAYAEESGPIKSLYFGIEEVPEFIDGLIKFSERNLAGLVSPDSEIDEFLRISKDATMISANPSFDKGFLEKNDLFRFHYRCLDIEAYAMAVLDLDFVPGMSEINTIINERFDENLPMGDHSAAGDVAALMAAHKFLQNVVRYGA